MQLFRAAFALFGIPLIALHPAEASAQQGTNEFGVDLTVAYGIVEGFSENILSVNLPLGRFRWAYFTSDDLAVETLLSVSVIDIGDETFTTFGGGLDLHYHFTNNPKRARPFLSFGGGVDIIDLDGATLTQWEANAGLGVKIPVTDVLGVRLQGQYARGFKTDDLPAVNEIGFLIGFSFFVGPSPRPRAQQPQEPSEPPSVTRADDAIDIPAHLPSYAAGRWVGSIEPPIGSSYTVSIVLQEAQPIGLAVGTASYDSPAETCKYTLVLETVSRDSFSVVQELDTGRCAARGRILFREEKEGVLVGDWFYPDGRRWLTAPVRKQR